MIRRAVISFNAVLIDGNNHLDRTRGFKHQCDCDIGALNKWITEPHEHHMVRTTFHQDFLTRRNIDTVFDVNHAHHAIVVLNMGVDFRARSGV